MMEQFNITANKRLLAIFFIAGSLLLIPLLAIQFTSEVKWSLADFIVAAILLFGTGGLIELVIRKVKTIKYRLLIAGILLLILALVWIELAVGIFESAFAGS